MKRFFIVLFMFMNVAAFAQLNTGKLDSFCNQLDKHNKAMFSIAISNNGKIEYKKTVGYADVENKLKANDNTLYHIGSVSKMFTACLIFKLIEEGKLAQETSLSKFFPSIKNAEKITIGQMLHHSSGITNFTADSMYESYMQKPQSDAQLIDRFSKLASDFDPGTQHDYSNTAYVLLSMVIESIEKKTFNDVLQIKICKPIGLKNTRISGPINTKMNMAHSYEMEEGKWKKATETDMSIPKGAGAIISTPSDICMFLEALFNNKVVTAKSLKDMQIIKEGYGKGIFQFPFGTKMANGHTGAIDAFHSAAAYFPEEKNAYCILGNAYDYDLNEISIGALSILFNKAFTIPTFEKVKLSGTAATSIPGKYRSDKIGMTITIFEKEAKLMAQAEGQSAFPLEKSKDDEYKFDQAGIIMLFTKNAEGTYTSCTLKQGGGAIPFEKIE